VLIVAGLSLKNLEPRVWDSSSPFYLPTLSAVMVSYAQFHQMPARRSAAMRMGLRAFLGVPDHMSVYLDNGAFFFGSQDGDAPLKAYEEFVEQAKPDWKPIPQDYIPFPSMSWQKQRSCYDKTMRVNRTYQHNGYVPVIHIGKYLPQFISCISTDDRLSKKTCIALGGIVPNLLRKPKAIPYAEVLTGLRQVRKAFRDKSIHVFGVGGTATLHLTALLGFNSVDSSGWRNRAARGIVQLPGCGERLVANLGNWRGRTPSAEEWTILRDCQCPACRKHGIRGLKAKKLFGFSCRATHNLWVLLKENVWLVKHLQAGTYESLYACRLDNSVYKPLIDETICLLKEERHRLLLQRRTEP
jgi:7-cyano-7-deazaguanine tRNA-ribosyltransferase